MKRTVCITGGGGYIGSVTTACFLQHGYRVMVVDNFSTGYKKPLEILQKKYGKRKMQFFKKDLRDDLTQLFQKEKRIDCVIHFASPCSVDESMKHPEKYFSNTVAGSMNLIKTMVQCDVSNIVFSSTCAVYGEAQYLPVDEEHPTNPTNPYGESKRMVEKALEWLDAAKKLKYISLRYFNVCGASEDGSLGDSKNPSVHLVQNAVRGALEIEPFSLTCPRVDTTDGTPIRDYIDVVDLAKGHILAYEYLKKGKKVK